MGIKYLSQKIHLQEAFEVRIPPSTGPQTPATATTAPIIVETNGMKAGLLISGKVTMLIEYNPAPPIPWKARKTISCVMLWEKPHAREKTANIKKAKMITCLRPSASASLAIMTAKPELINYE